MISGELAARAIAAPETLSDPAATRRAYDRLWRGEIGGELRDAVLIQRYLFASHDRVNRVLRAGRTQPWLADTVLAFTRGELSYASMRWRLLRKFPLSLVRLAGQYLSAQLPRAQTQE
jgi:flavin-dependent dehydrogenase